jgi:glycosyltransferase involved in cell wall biosynthesis
LLAVGRLHPVKDHAFLVRACAELHGRKIPFQCFIVGEGTEHLALESLIQQCGLEENVHLLGFVSQEKRDSLYDEADAVVLTSRSEGIPVVLMEAMARGKIVAAPAITGIPELVIPGKTGFLYKPGSMDDLVQCLSFIRSQLQSAPAERLEWIRHGARIHVRQNFNRSTNVHLFADILLRRIAPQGEITHDESPLLQ